MSSAVNVMNWNHRQLQAFVEICRLQSFSKAAEQIAISQSGISMLVRELESQVGARLFDRTTRLVAPTEAARTLLPVALRVLTDLQAVGVAISGARAFVESRLTMAATPTVSANLLPAVVMDFAQTHPGVRIELHDVDVDGVRRRVLSGEAAIGLGFFFKPAVEMRRSPLCQFRLMSISPANEPLGDGPTLPWRALARVPLMGLPPRNPIQSLIDKHLAAVRPANEQRPTMNLIGTIIAMVEAGLGHAVLPSFALPECRRRRIAVAMLDAPAVSIDLMLASRTGARPSAAALAFAAALKIAAAQMAEGIGASNAPRA